MDLIRSQNREWWLSSVRMYEIWASFVHIEIKAIYLKLEKFMKVLQERHSKYEEDVLSLLVIFYNFGYFFPNLVFLVFFFFDILATL